MSFNAYFKVVKTISVSASFTGLSIEEEVERTKQVNRAPKEVTKKRKRKDFSLLSFYKARFYESAK